MAQFKCDLCGGLIKMLPDKTGACQECGMVYGLETLQKMANLDSSLSAQQSNAMRSTDNAMINPTKDDIDHETMVAYLDDVRIMETIILKSNQRLKELEKEKQSETNKFNKWKKDNQPVVAKENAGIAPSKPNANSFQTKKIDSFFSYHKKMMKENNAMLCFSAIFRVIIGFVLSLAIVNEIAVTEKSFVNNTGETYMIYNWDYQHYNIIKMITENQFNIIGYIFVGLLLFSVILSVMGIFSLEKPKANMSNKVYFIRIVLGIVSCASVFILEVAKEIAIVMESENQLKGYYINGFSSFLVIGLAAAVMCNPIKILKNYKPYFVYSLKCKKENKDITNRYNDEMAKYADAVNAYNTKLQNIENKYNYEMAEKQNAYNQRLAQLEEQYNCVMAEINDIVENIHSDIEVMSNMLESEYNVNIIPRQFRNIQGVYYLFDYLSTSRQSLSEALMQCNLEAIKNKLDNMIQKQATMIVEQRRQNVLQGKVIDLSQQILQNSAVAARAAVATAQNTANIAGKMNEISSDIKDISYNSKIAAEASVKTAQNTSAIAANTSAIATNTASMNQQMRYQNSKLEQIYKNENALNNMMRENLGYNRYISNVVSSY